MRTGTAELGGSAAGPHWWGAALLAAACFACAVVGNSPALLPEGFVDNWFPTGLVLAALLRARRRHWATLSLAGFLAGAVYYLWSGETLAPAVLFAAGNGLEILAAAWLVRRFVAERPDLSTVRQVAGLAGACALTAVVGAASGAAVAALAGEGGSYAGNWLAWWSSDVLGVLLLAPPVLAWPAGARRLHAWKPAKCLEAAAFAALLCACAIYIFRDDWHPHLALKYVLFLFAVWAAFRFGVLGTAACNVAVAAVAAWCTVEGYSAFAEPGMSPLDRRAALYLFKTFYAAAGLLLAAALAERRRASRELAVAADLLRLVNASGSTRELVRSAVSFFRAQSGCEAVGVRLRDGDDYPYYEVHGFPPEFVLLENQLCERDAAGEAVRDDAGNPVIACMCGNVICGRFDPAKPFFTPRGSFWSNSTTELLASTTEADRQARTRNRCNGEGYESVALLPLCAGDERLGLLQLNDRRRGMFDAETVALWERLTNHLAMGLAKLRAEEALRESEVQYRSLFQNMTQGAFRQRADGTLVDINAAALRMFGLARDEFLGRTSATPEWDVVAEDGTPLPGAEHPSMRALAAGKPVFDAVVGVRNARTGGRVWMEVNAIPEFHPGEAKPHQVLVTLHDVTERKLAADALRRERDRAQSYLDTVEAIIVALDREGRIALVNRKGCRLLGFDEGELVGRSWFATCLPQPDGTERVYPYFLRLMAGQVEPEEYFENAVITRGGEVRQIAWHNALLRDDGGRIAGVLSAGEDVTERRRAEQALRAREAEYRSLVQAMPDVVMRFDRDGRHLFVSDNVEEMVGIPAAQFLGRTHRELGFPQRLCNFWEDAVRRVFDGGLPHETEFSVDSPRGPMTFNWRLVPETDAEGRTQSVLSIARDITAHREAERNYRTIFREMLDGFALHEIVCDADGRPVDYRFLAVNPAFERMTGLTAPAVVGRTVREVLPQTEPHWIETYGRVALTGEPAFFENYHAELGKHFQVTAFRPVPNQFACIFVDITERKRAEHALLESQTELQAIYDHAPVMMCVLNADREVQYVNRALAAFVGRPQTELVHDRACGIFGCVRALDDPRGCGFGPDCAHCTLRLAMLDTMQTGAGHTGVEYQTTLLLDGRTRDVTLLGSTARIRSGGQDMLLLCLADITDRKRAEEERRRLEAQMLHTQKLESLGVLAGGIAHDFNNLLGAIVSNADLAKHQLAADSPAQPHIERSLRAAARAADLTRQMLTYSGKRHVALRPVDLGALVEENAHLLHACIAKEAELRLELREDLPPVEADPGQLQQVVMNLITNAAEALGQRPGTVSLRTGTMHCDEAALLASRVEEQPPPGEFVFLEVADTGCGMDAETKQRLFDPFFSTKFTGRGLGLSAVLGIVRGHRGAIFVESEPGWGTTVRVLFPVARAVAVATAEQPALAPPSSAAAPSFSGTVLMADDDEIARAACQAVLSSFGFKVLAAADGEEAVRIFRERADAISCVVLDLTMPKLDGLAACRAMREIKPDVKVVLVSGYDESEALGQIGGAGPAGFVQKPYRLRALAEEIHRVLHAT